MKVISFLVMVLVVAFMVLIDIILFGESVAYGLGGIIGMVAFYIAYSISVEMSLAPRDFWVNSSWEIFKKKLGYAFGAYLVTTLVASGMISSMLA